MHTLLVTAHVLGAIGGLITGSLALIYPNGTSRHRLIGKLYLVSWLLIAVPAYTLGADDGRISIFEGVTAFSVFSVIYAYAMVLFRKRIGRSWLPRHYNWMLSSMAGLVVATINQVLPRLGVEYPIWVFIALCIAPAFVIPLVARRLDRRYGFAPSAATPRPQRADAI